MVSQYRRPRARSRVRTPGRPPGRAAGGGPGTRERVLAAATEEFSARGFDGATVDRIADRARVNKAMLYYHFDDKAALYRAILRDLFTTMAARLAAGVATEAAPDEQVRQFIRILAAELAARPLYPSIWLREMAESGRHLDASSVEPIAAIIRTLHGILQEGHRRGVFRPAHPLVVQMGIVAPLLLFASSAPTRRRFARVLPAGARDTPAEAVVAHVEAATLAALRVPDLARAPSALPGARTSSSSSGRAGR
jgi:AcrR family transcriptional regulator